MEQLSVFIFFKRNSSGEAYLGRENEVRDSEKYK